MTIILYLIGRPGSGKYSIAKEIAKSGYIICDNQLINNPIFSLLNYDGFMTIPKFAWDTIAQIRGIVFNFLSQQLDNNYVLTNVLGENSGDRTLFSQVEQIALKRGSIFIPVKLIISPEENAKRVQNPERLLRFKSIDPQEAYSEEPLLNVHHPYLLNLDVTTLSAKEAAEKILEHIERIRNGHP
jgi:hypothetical protein